MCSWPTTSTPGRASADAKTLSAGRVAITTCARCRPAARARTRAVQKPPPPDAPGLGKQHHRRQAPEGTGEAALAPALVVGRHHFDTGWERDVRRIAVADRAEHRHVVSLGEVAGDVEAGARGAAHSPGVG